MCGMAVRDEIPGVMELVRARLREGSVPGARRDPYKLALVAQGGGQLWVVISGFLAYLRQAGVTADMVVGTSSGLASLAYFAGGHEAEICGRMVRHLTNKGYARNGKGPKLIDPKNLLRGQPMLDVEGLVEEVFGQRVRLSFETIETGAMEVWAACSCPRTGGVVMEAMHGQPEARQKAVMKDTARIPLLAHDVRDGDVLWDGGLTAGIPLPEARALGATHALVLRSNGLDEGKAWAPGKVERWVLGPLLRKRHADLARMMATRHEHYAQVEEMLAAGDDTLRVMQMPHVDTGMGEMREERLLAQLAAAYKAAPGMLGMEEMSVPEAWGVGVR